VGGRNYHDLCTALHATWAVPERGKPVTGLPNTEGRDEVPYDYSAQTKLHYNPNGMDIEGLVRTSAGDFWLCEEYSPSIVHVD
jgi:Esterase-like activity of phytase